VVGQVKTRLHPFLSKEVIFELYTHFLHDSIQKIGRMKSVDRFIGVYPSDASGFFSRLDDEFALKIFFQEGKDLGEKMANAFQARFAEGYERVVIIGSDSPSLPVAYIEQALSSEKDLTIGPSTDGGYYLIGMRGFYPFLFDDIPWSTPDVLNLTMTRLKSRQLEWRCLAVHRDLDTPDDYNACLESGNPVLAQKA